MINFDCIKNESIKSVTVNAFKKYKDYIRMKYNANCDIIIGSNVTTRDCEFHRMNYKLSSNSQITHKDCTIKFSDIQNKTKIMHLSTDFLFLRLDSEADHIMDPYKRFISILQPKFVLLNYHQNKVPISSCCPEIKYYVDTVDGYKIIDKGACKNGQYYDILTKYMSYDKKIEFECYFVEYVLLLERIV